MSYFNTELSSSSSSTLNIKLYILDPLSVIIKLAIMAKKPIGTKIIIRNNIIQFHEMGYFQGIFRYLHGSNKFDLHYLYNPIQMACSHFLLMHDSSSEKHRRIQHLFSMAQKGIKNLIETYKSTSMVHVCLNYYLSMINNYIKNESVNMFHKDNMTSLYTSEIVKELHTIWNESRIKIILDLIEFLDDDLISPTNVVSLENIMNDIDLKTQDIMGDV